MTNQVRHVPAALLLSPDLSVSAKLIWMVEGLRPAGVKPGTTWLCQASGLSRPTVLTALAQLAAQGWDPARAEEPAVPVPAALLTNRKIGIHGRVLYGLLLLTPAFSHPSGSFTYAELAAMSHASPNTAAKAVAELASAEWIMVERKSRLARIRFELTFPGCTRGMDALAAAQSRLNHVDHYGEGLMREYLSLLIDQEDYQDGAFHGFLVNPRTGELLQLDRFYPPNVGFEFNGPQHNRATDKYPAQVVARQQERDYVKLGICVTRGITLVTIYPEDLTLKRMQQKVANLLPLRDLTGHELLIDHLEMESSDYRASIAAIK
ncbi:MAG TPA: hypothetical protein VD902_02335 [Symbiobacteriaceae bacterium]|nr:hypothetical protein [Symbiobacteriaceae bacterium]